ncbi:hypothetical protein HID58_032784 [Brassica napus]|uniref:Bifunctional inhibitor/plant lipid transfer protein/seed storage helical domain-containing protein n=1 Tax=Brassica napus TaxID=3708 RepID=A0ABQ8BXD8_BRANA|nr:hypothetical protein HID58_032784 [Brassica napus]
MKMVALLLITFVIALASFPPPTSSKSNAKSCLTSAVKVCFDGIARGAPVKPACCASLKEHHTCLCDIIKSRMVDTSVLSSSLKSCALLLIAFVVLLASFPPPTKAIAVKGSRSKRNGESCATNALQVCFDGIAKRMMMSTACCEQLKEHHSCLCDVIKTRILDSNVENNAKQLWKNQSQVQTKTYEKENQEQEVEDPNYSIASLKSQI